MVVGSTPASLGVKAGSHLVTRHQATIKEMLISLICMSFSVVFWIKCMCNKPNVGTCPLESTPEERAFNLQCSRGGSSGCVPILKCSFSVIFAVSSKELGLLRPLGLSVLV